MRGDRRGRGGCARQAGQLHRSDAVGAEPADRAGGGSPRRHRQRVGHDVAVTIGSIRAGLIGPAGRWKACGWARPFRVTVATIRSCVGQNGPARDDTSQPVRSVSAHWPTGRSRSGVERARRGGAICGRDDEPRAQVIEGFRLVEPDRHDPATVRSPGGMVGPARRGEDLAGFGSSIVHVDRPDRRPRMHVCVRPPS